LAFTEELREIAYLDRAVLIRVIHPEGTAVFTDESTRQGGIEPLRVFVVREKDLEIPPGVVSSRKPGAAADLVAAIDRRSFKPYVESRPQWSGWVEPFSLEIELPAEWRRGEPPRAPALFLTGRVAWHNSVVAYSLSQHGRTWDPHRLEYIDADGTAREALANVGYPGGRDRTIVVPLENLGSARKLRLSAASRLFWDRIALARDALFVELPERGDRNVRAPGSSGEISIETDVLPLARAELAWRGFSEIVGDFDAHEHVYDFDKVSVWRDFPVAEGKATRYGDVRPLVEAASDLLAVLAPGDALWLDFDGGSEIAPGKTVTYFLKLTG